MSSTQHILFDARKILDYGIGTYIASLSAMYGRIDPGFRFSSFVLSHTKNDGLLPQAWTRHAVRHRQFSIGEFALLGRVISRIRPDLYHATHYTLPASVPCKTVVTIYDVIPLLFPKIFNPAKRLYARTMVKHALTISERVIVPSKATKDAILERFHVHEGKITVIPLGVPEHFLQLDKRAAALDARHLYRLQRPYILFVSNPKPHKGIETLLQAFATLDPALSEVELVFTGGDEKSVSRLRAIVSMYRLENRTRILGRIPGGDIPGVIAGADLLVFPSFYEGFGLPLLEAMAVSTPVVSSDAGSLPEVGGDAVHSFETGSVDQLRAGMERVLNDAAYRKDLVDRGLRRVAQYSWRETAQRTLQCYAEVLGNE